MEEVLEMQQFDDFLRLLLLWTADDSLPVGVNLPS
jgi:hypothetical protein